MNGKKSEEERRQLFDKWCQIQDEMIALSQAQVVLVRMKHPKAREVEPILEDAIGVKRYEADSLKRELDADQVRVI